MNPYTVIGFGSEKEYEELRTKDGSVSIEIIMTVDDGKEKSPLRRLFCIDDFRDLTINELGDAIEEGTKKTARVYTAAAWNGAHDPFYSQG